MRPIPQSGLDNLKKWMESHQWDEVLNTSSVDEKATNFQNILIQKIDQFLPEKILKISSDDKPWITEKIKKMDRKKKREYHKNRQSPKYKALEKSLKRMMNQEKKKFKKNMIDTIKDYNNGN